MRSATSPSRSAWGNYFKTLVAGFGIDIPAWPLNPDYRTGSAHSGLFEQAPHLLGVPIVFNILAFAIVAFITIILVIGIRESASMKRRHGDPEADRLGALRHRRLELHPRTRTGRRLRRTAGRASNQGRRSSFSPTSASTRWLDRRPRK